MFAVVAVLLFLFLFFFFNDTATTEIYTLSLHDALPISNALRSPWRQPLGCLPFPRPEPFGARWRDGPRRASKGPNGRRHRSGGKRRRDVRLSAESVQAYAFFQSGRPASGEG